LNLEREVLLNFAAQVLYFLLGHIHFLFLSALGLRGPLVDKLNLLDKVFFHVGMFVVLCAKLSVVHQVLAHYVFNLFPQCRLIFIKNGLELVLSFADEVCHVVHDCLSVFHALQLSNNLFVLLLDLPQVRLRLGLDVDHLCVDEALECLDFVVVESLLRLQIARHLVLHQEDLLVVQPDEINNSLCELVQEQLEVVHSVDLLSGLIFEARNRVLD